MTTRFLQVSLSLILFLALCGRGGLHAEEKLSRKPNIVFFLVDDLGYGDLGYSGSTLAETPNIDRFARQNMVFTSGYVPAPHCSPSRAGIVTGQTPARLHITVWIGNHGQREYKNLELPVQRTFLPRGTPTIAHYLKTLGYTTANIGKWHIGGQAVPITEHGFDEVIGWAPGAGPGPAHTWYAPYPTIRDLDGPEGEYLTDRLTDESIAFMERQGDRPFFLMLQHYDVHAPLTAPSPTVQKYLDRGRPLIEGKESATFLAMKEHMDISFGRILDALDDLGIADNTIVVFFSDNGGVTYFANNGPLRFGKKFLHEGGIRVPLIMRVPGMTTPGSVSDVPVNGIDFFPTFIDLTGGNPADIDAPLDGVSLRPLFEGETLDREALFWHKPQVSREWIDIPPQGAVRMGPWKLIHYYGETQPDELYNLDDDIGEQNNLAARHPEKVQRMREMLERHLDETQAQRVIIR